MNENQYVGRGVLCISWQGPEERVSFEDRDHTELWGGFTSGKYGSDSGISLAQRQVLHAHIPNKYEEKMVRPKHIKFPLPLYPCGGGSQGRRERWKPLFSSWEKEMHATERGWNQHFSFSFPTKKKRKDFNFNMKIWWANMQPCLGRYVHFKCIYCHYWENLQFVDH